MMSIEAGQILLPGIVLLLLIASVWSIVRMKRRQTTRSHRAFIDEARDSDRRRLPASC